MQQLNAANTEMMQTHETPAIEKWYIMSAHNGCVHTTEVLNKGKAPAASRSWSPDLDL